MEYKDYYKILGVDKKATDDEIKKAYRKLARKYHPDVSKEANAEDKFKEAKEAYEVLKDPEKRSTYDNMGDYQQYQNQQGHGFGGAGFSGADFGGGFGGDSDYSDFFSSIFGGGGFQQGGRRGPIKQKGQDQHASITISLYDAFHGSERSLALNGATGQQQLNVKIPKGIRDGQQIRLSGKGSPGYGGGPNGDLYLEVHVTASGDFTLEGRDIYVTVPITPWEAALGASIQAPTMTGKVNLKIPADTQSGKKLRLKGKGMPGKQPGDQYVLLKIVAPKANTEEKKALYEKMAEAFDSNPREAS